VSECSPVVLAELCRNVSHLAISTVQITIAVWLSGS
jgi:hypothetical protein